LLKTEKIVAKKCGKYEGVEGGNEDPKNLNEEDIFTY